MLSACSGTEGGDRSNAEAAQNDAPVPASGALQPEQFVSFIEAGSNFSTDDVFDADRERVRFDATRGTMIFAAGSDSVSGWTTAGNDLTWTGSGVAFRVRFGTESGERRAYFTETGSGTICNLSIDGPDRLSIRGTNELPPSP